ncbi:MAG TPA: hypothetical protein VFN15_02080 [Solirubrobacterales bacterium]|nr:hypothetical protein [Solirubrobacterales bacterium]
MSKLTDFKLEPAKVRITQEEILADLQYPIRRARPYAARPRGRRR